MDWSDRALDGSNMGGAFGSDQPVRLHHKQVLTERSLSLLVSCGERYGERPPCAAGVGAMVFARFLGYEADPKRLERASQRRP